MFLQAGLFVLTLGSIAQGAPRIIGGHDAPNHKHPYIISFRGYGNRHFCGGSILNERWILSAAHCFKDRDLETFSIVSGTNFLNETGTVYLPQLYVTHEKYQNFYNYDIALIRLRSNIVFTDFVKPIALPDKDLQDYSIPAIFSGWGVTKLGGDASNALQEIELNVLTFEQCKLRQETINHAHVCTLNQFDQGICYGDSGSPLVVEGVQVGIASYVRPCAVDYPDVYTRVWSYRDWINSTMERYANIWE